MLEELIKSGLVEMLFDSEERFGFQLSDPMRFQHMRFAEMVQAIAVVMSNAFAFGGCNAVRVARRAADLAR